jgi:uncharacterized protein
MKNKNPYSTLRVLSDKNIPLSEALEAPDEPYDVLDAKAIDISRLCHSIMEELQAFNDYNLRMSATNDKDIRRVLEHNRNEEAEHFVLFLELLRMRMPVVDEMLKKYLYKEDKEME